MKLLLVHVWNEKELSYRGRFSELLSYPSLTLAVLYSLIPEGVFERIDVIDENSQRVDYDKQKYDIVMLSFETSSSLSAYKHCAEFRKRGAYVVCGGYHATALPEEAAEHCHMAEFYDDTDEQVFLRDFYDKDYCLALYHDTAGLVGFTTQKVMEVEADGRTIHGVFSGDTIIHRSYWGDIELFKVWADFWFGYGEKYDEFYWFLICKGYKTYRILPLFWKEFYPCCNKETPLHIQNIIDAYAQKLYPDEYDKTDGVIKYSHLKDKLRAGVADVGEREMKNKDIAYFCERNPGYIKGNDLACIARIDRAALKKRAAELLFG